MNLSSPHYLLSSEANRIGGLGHWRFVLRAVDESARYEAADVEPDTWGERLDLLTVVRALESLDQPSKVTLVVCSRYVEQGIQYGLAEWRENGWQWEAFGQMVPVRDADLWQRMDRILQFHQLECGQRRLDGGHSNVPPPHWGHPKNTCDFNDRTKGGDWVKYITPVLAFFGGCWMDFVARFWHQVFGLGSSFIPHRS